MSVTLGRGERPTCWRPRALHRVRNQPRCLASAETWRLLLIASNGFSSPRDEWMDQSDHEWVLVLRGSACVALQNPDRIVDLSPGDHLLLSPHQRHRVERTDPDPGTVWLALHWDAA